MKRSAEYLISLWSWLDRVVLAHGVEAFAPVVALRARVEACGAFVQAEPELIATLGLLENLEGDAGMLAACILHTLQQCGVALTAPELARLPPGVRDLLDGQQAAEKVWSLHAARNNAGSAEGLRRLLLAIIRDLRVVFILLARQLVRMRAAASLPPQQRHELAQLTADIHAPLANRLGIWQLKWELEDLVFRYLHGDTYRRIAKLVDERRADRERFIAVAMGTLRRALAEAGIEADIAGRPKHIYSIWKKMQRKGGEFSALYDIRALRLLVKDVAACYAALGIVHALWPPVPSEFDDYIARPKGNHYQSLHTAVIGPEGKTLEVQIRSHEMHAHAERGVAAHWRYKEGGGGDQSFERKISWMRQLLEAKDEHEDDAALLAGFKTDILEDRVYLLTPQGQVMDLPRDATVLDFAYHVHTDVGHRCQGAKVNGRIVPLNFQPASGDRVEILTGKTLEPRRDWLSAHHGYLTTHRAQQKVRAWFKHADLAANLAAGRAILDKELKRLALGNVELDTLPPKFHVRTLDDLLVALALGDVTPSQIARVLHETHAPAPAPSAPVPRAPKRDKDAVVIEGVGNLLTTLARCCQPLPGDAIAGFITRGRGVSIHRTDCASFARLRRSDPSRAIEVEWGGARSQSYEVDLLVRGYDRKWLHKDVTNVIAAANVHLLAVNTRVDPATSLATMNFAVRVADFEQLSTLLGRLSGVPNVIEARRLA
ncbi:MAG TPA: bifunctional (p)ppGpp synthetase/guanosine-3',5'-bis(diphosphate) 3'-pyrophosphohydrolase [Rudaea sp.]|nr:bifunctional (p)ppGpp synthetase/guanosine-3',5'-bis(diphosphate) 3'-pyrophosphohydrolase [Rudaea sp.]